MQIIHEYKLVMPCTHPSVGQQADKNEPTALQIRSTAAVEVGEHPSRLLSRMADFPPSG